MAGIPFLHNIDLNNHQLLNAKLHPSDSAPSSPGIGTIWYDTGNDLVKIYDNTATGNVGGWNTITGDITGVNITAGNGLSGTSVNTTAGTHTQTLTIGQGTGITVNSSDVAVTAAQTGITSILNSSLVVGRDDHNQIDFSTDNEIKFKTNNETPVIIMKASGEIEATKFDGALEGNADTATALATGRTIAMTGDVHWTSSSFDGSGNVTGTSTIQADSVHASMINDDLISGSASALTSGLASTDELLVSDAGTLKNMDISVLQSYLQSNLTFTTNTDINVNVANLTARLPQITESVTIGDATDVTVTTSGDLVVTGDLTVSGDTVTVNTETLSVEDPLIILAKNNNSSDAVDIGLYGLYDTSGSQDLYGGLFRDANDSGKWKLFKDLQAAPTTTVNTGGTGYATGTLVANIEGNLTIGGHTVADIDIGSEFNDVDDHLMSSGAIKEKIESYGYTTDANVTHRPVTAGGNTLANSETLAFTAGSNVTITESGGAVTIASTNTNTQLATAAALVDVSVMAGNSTASFTHSLSSQNLIVQLYDTTSGKVVHADIDHTSTDAIAITFAQTGTQMAAAGIGDIRVVVIDAVHGVSDSTVAYS